MTLDTQLQLESEHVDQMQELGYPLPFAEDCITFAMTEAGEMVEAMIRLFLTDYVRTNEKKPDLPGEFADVGQMLLKSIIAIQRGHKGDGLPHSVDLGLLCYAIADAYTLAARGLDVLVESRLAMAYRYWRGLCDLHECDPDELLSQRREYRKEKQMRRIA